MLCPPDRYGFCRGPLPGLVLLIIAAGTVRGAEADAPDYLEAIVTADEFEALSIPSRLEGDKDRFTKFLVPAIEEPDLLPALFQNVGRYPFHFDFLRLVFPERFPGLDMTQYLELVEFRATRKYYAGILTRYNTGDGALYGFSVFTANAGLYPEELLSAEETHTVYELLSAAFALDALHYAPESQPALEAALAWQEPGFPVYSGGVTQSSYQAYTRATGCGRVRLLTAGEFETANEKGQLTWQDIVVLEIAPSDIEGVVAGVVTGEPQGELSHIAIRTARRGTPNAYVKDALEVFEPLEGKLVRLEVGTTTYTAAEVTQQDAETWWDQNRPSLSEEPVLDTAYDRLDSLEEMDLSGDPVPPEARFGGKAANLARLQTILTGPLDVYRERGFAIPVRYYFEFLRANRTRSPLDRNRIVTYEEYLEELLSWEEFQSDSEVRFRALERFREEVEDNGVVDLDLIARIASRVEEVFGSHRVMTRFRSSSNVEDNLEFNGAGLYSSASGCAADELDGDADGPSQCNADASKEKRIVEALKEVWASLWTFRAHEERSYYGIDPASVGMAILVTRTFSDELANGVAFTGNPANALDPRYLVTAQVGEESVVTPEPGQVTEKDVLEVEDGVVTRIERVRSSSLASPGEPVLSDGILGELGAVLWHIDGDFPIDLGSYSREEVLFDVEFKVEESGDLAVKQVRPFLLGDAPEPGPTFELRVPPGTFLCAVFVDGRSPREEYALRSRIRLAAGTHALPAVAPSFPTALVEELLLGPDQEVAAPLDEGRFRWERRVGDGGAVTYDFRYEQAFSAAGERWDFALPLSFTVRPGEEPELVLELSEETITHKLFPRAIPEGDRLRQTVYGSCLQETLPRWDVHVELEGGDVLDLEERFLDLTAGSGPASLAGAVVTLDGQTQEVRDYWRLVYAAQHHNEDVEYLVALDPPLATPAGSVSFVEIAEPIEEPDRPGRVLYLDGSFATLASPRVSCYEKAPAGQLQGCGRFRRGDADSNGKVDLTDAVFTLLYLFQGGQAPACLDAADFNDDADVEITDPILILNFLFLGVDLSAPPGPYRCGEDLLPDAFPTCLDPTCR